MEYSELQHKGFEIAKRYENLPLQDRLNIIAETFGCKTASLETSLCTGKYRGYSDILLVLDNGAHMGIGMHRTPQAKTARVINECVNNTLAQYNPEIVSEIIERATVALSKREAKDNTIAAQKGLKPYTFLNVELNNGSEKDSGGHLGWYYLTVAVDNKIFGLVESGLNSDITRGVVNEDSRRPKYFVAGGLRDNEADFVFDNVGHSSFKDSYKMPLNDLARERAEKRLNERTAAEKSIEKQSSHAFNIRPMPEQPDTHTIYANGTYEDIKKNYPPYEGILPDSTIGLAERNEYGYVYDGLLPLNRERALELYDTELPIYMLYNDTTDSLVKSVDDILKFNGVFGVEVEDWEASDIYAEMAAESSVEDKFYVDKESQTVKWVYFNPDSEAGGQYVHNYFDFATIEKAMKGSKTAEEFFDYIGAVCKQELTDIDTEDFAYEDRAFKNDPYDFADCSAETMDALKSFAIEPVGYLKYADSGEVVAYYAESDILSAYKDALYSLSPGAVRYQDVTDKTLNNKLYAMFASEYGDDMGIIVDKPPDQSIGLSEMNLYGYAGDDMLPLTKNRALELFDQDLTIFMLYEDNTEAMVFDRNEILTTGAGVFGIEREEWEASPEFKAVSNIARSDESRRESELLYNIGKDDGMFGIYQLKRGDELRDYRFEPFDNLTQRGLAVDRDNYELVYTAPMTIRSTTINLNKVYADFNDIHPGNRPDDFKGHSVSVSDVIVLQWRGEISSHYVNDVGFKELSAFLGNERSIVEQNHYADIVQEPISNQLNKEVQSSEVGSQEKGKTPPSALQTPPSKKPSLLGQLDKAKAAIREKDLLKNPAVKNKNNQVEV